MQTRLGGSIIRRCGAGVALSVHLAVPAQPAAVAPATPASAVEAAQTAAREARQAADEAKAAAAVPRSDGENLVGDQFRMTVPTGGFRKAGCTGSFEMPVKSVVRVISASAADSNELTVRVMSSDDMTLPPAAGSTPETCKVHSNVALTASARELKRLGAVRTGWVYGVLTLPYKYHFDDKSLGSSVSIGPYLGRRTESAGRGYAWAATAGLTSVEVATGGVDGAPTTSVQAITLAVGVMFDLTKSAKPFKVGIFAGQDRAGSRTPTPYVHEGKTWAALQLGWDFSD